MKSVPFLTEKKTAEQPPNGALLSAYWNPPSKRCPDVVRLTTCMLAACPFPANHGTPGSIREMAEAISERGHDVHIVTYHFGENIPVRGPQLHRIPPLTRESSVVV